MTYAFKHGDRPLDGLTIQRAVGRGGFGEVYYALTDSGKQIAVKYLRENPDVELRGIAHVMNLKSPHLITIYDVRHSEAEEPFVIMEYVSGPSLRDLLIAEPSGLGAQKAAFFIKGIASGLSYLHERGIVHRDLKPGNIFYDDGYVKIGDYGLSKHIAVSAHSGNTMSVGTVHYMAPEIGSGSYTKSIDIYALGVMLYEMLTGRLPFTGSSMGEILMRHLSDKPDVSGLPEPFAEVIAKALAKNPQDRWPNVDEMVEALTSIETVSESLASFDASVLAATPRVEAREEDLTMTTPPRRPEAPVLDARDEGDLPPIPPIPSVLSPKDARRARRLQTKARKVQERARNKARAMRAKLADMGVGQVETAQAGRAVRSGRWRQVMISLIVLFAVAGGLGMIHGDGVVFGASLLFLFLGTLGTLLAYSLGSRRNMIDYNFQDRLLFAASGFVFLLPGMAAGYEVGRRGDDFAMLIIPLTALLLLFNWNDRIQLGRRQVTNGGTVFWHGVLGLLIAGPATDGQYVLEGGVLAATMLVLVQSIAGLWPMHADKPSESPDTFDASPDTFDTTPPQHGAWGRVEGAYQRVTGAVDRVGKRLDRLARGDDNAVEKDKATETDETAPAGDQRGAAPLRPAPEKVAIAQGFQPSFVGRTANAGLSFLAKLLLLTGLTAAVLFSRELVDFNNDEVTVMVGGGRVIYSEHGRVQVDTRIPKAVVIAPLLLGTILLVTARRHDGAAHFLRGFLGSASAFAAAVVAMGPGAEPLGMFLKGMNIPSRQEDALIQAGLLLALSIVLLFWPKRRENAPIVV